jgi:hypothetical protein
MFPRQARNECFPQIAQIFALINADHVLICAWISVNLRENR